jgi:hypothetical protein
MGAKPAWQQLYEKASKQMCVTNTKVEKERQAESSLVTTWVFLANIFSGSEIPACSSWILVTTSRKGGYMKPPFTFGNHAKVYAVITTL